MTSNIALIRGLNVNEVLNKTRSGMSDSDYIDLTNDDDDEQPSLSMTQLQELQNAILDTPEERLRDTLLGMLARRPELRGALFDELVAREDADRETATADLAAAPGSPPLQHSERGQARQPCAGPAHVPQLEVCANCDDAYDAGSPRETGECRMHPGACYYVATIGDM